MRRASIVIPIKDEESAIGVVLERLRKATSAVESIEFEVLVVDDGSVDRGPEIARSYGARVIENPAPHGKGAALRRGFSAASGDVIVMMDGDDSHRPEDLGAFLEALAQGASLVIGSRIFGGSEEYTALRAFGNIVLTYAFGVLHGRYLSDALNGYKAFRREVYTSFDYTSTAFEIEIELLVNTLRLGGAIVEIPSHERARAGGRSKSSIVRHGSRFLARIVYERLRHASRPTS
jgi:glycosyltransferase involved in cell wall biosynthesis